MLMFTWLFLWNKWRQSKACPLTRGYNSSMGSSDRYVLFRERRLHGDPVLFYFSELLPTSFCTMDNPSCHLEDVECSTDTDCYDVFPNLATAIGMGKIYPQPSAPVCRSKYHMISFDLMNMLLLLMIIKNTVVLRWNLPKLRKTVTRQKSTDMKTTPAEIIVWLKVHGKVA